MMGSSIASLRKASSISWEFEMYFGWCLIWNISKEPSVMRPLVMRKEARSMSFICHVTVTRTALHLPITLSSSGPSSRSFSQKPTVSLEPSLCRRAVAPPAGLAMLSRACRGKSRNYFRLKRRAHLRRIRNRLGVALPQVPAGWRDEGCGQARAQTNQRYNWKYFRVPPLGFG